MSEVEEESRIDNYSAALIELESGGTSEVPTYYLKVIIEQCQREIRRRDNV